MVQDARRESVTWHRLKAAFGNQRGSLLVETLVALGVFSMIGIAILAAVQTGHITKGKFDEQSTGENLIRKQLESVFAQPYLGPGGSYQPVAAPSGYSVMTESLVHDATSTDIENIRVTVYHQGRLLDTVETLRSRR